MATNEVRKDYLLNRWVVIAKDRGKRPTDFVKKETTQNQGVCPFCPGNEQLTPPAVLIYRQDNGEIRKEIDHNGNRPKDWVVRVVPNAYPAFTPPDNNITPCKTECIAEEAAGHHEVVIESPIHDEHPGVVRPKQLLHVLNACLDRLTTLSSKPYVKHVAIFKNHGREAGASLSHTHTQLIAMPFIPPIIRGELEASRKHWTQQKSCLLCDILEKERNSPRFIWENNSFIAFAPWASVNPLEFWLMPKQHSSNLANINKTELKDLAQAMRVCMGGLCALINNPPYNFGFHTTIGKDARDFYHWHLEVYPRLAVWAGFEKSTGVFINAISPEDSAAELKKAFDAEEKSLEV